MIKSKLRHKVLKVRKKGYGSALIKGIEFAEGEFIVMGDADDTYDFMDSVVMIDTLRNDNCDLIIGNRLEGNIEKGAMPFLHKYLGNPVLSMIGRYLFNLKINDFHCGLRAIKTSVAKELPFSVKGMEFATEMIALSSIYK